MTQGLWAYLFAQSKILFTIGVVKWNIDYNPNDSKEPIHKMSLSYAKISLFDVQSQEFSLIYSLN